MRLKNTSIFFFDKNVRSSDVIIGAGGITGVLVEPTNYRNL